MILATYKLSDCLRSHGLLVVSRETFASTSTRTTAGTASWRRSAGRQAGGPAASRPPQPPREGGDRVSLAIVIPNLHVPVLGSCWPACPVVVLLWEPVRDVSAGIQHPSHTMFCTCSPRCPQQQALRRSGPRKAIDVDLGLFFGWPRSKEKNMALAGHCLKYFTAGLV